MAGEPLGGSEHRVLEEVAAAWPAPCLLEQHPAAERAGAQVVLPEAEGVPLAVGEAPEGAVAEAEPREHPRQSGRRIPDRDVEPVAADGGEAHAVGEGRQAAEDEVRELRREGRPARRARRRSLAQPGAHGRCAGFGKSGLVRSMAIVTCTIACWQ